MTPKEKAIELIDKFQNVKVTVFGCESNSNPCVITENVTIKSAKELALIAVDEVYKSTPLSPYDKSDVKNMVWYERLIDAYKFWSEVKKEIGNL